MALGRGKYDELCTYVREHAKAAGAVVIVIDGEYGNGFSCQAGLDDTIALPAFLEHVAQTIRESGPFVPGDSSWPKPVCPNCGGIDFKAGPRGGLSTNIQCRACQRWFNYTPVLADLQPIGPK